MRHVDDDDMQLSVQYTLCLQICVYTMNNLLKKGTQK